MTVKIFYINYLKFRNNWSINQLFSKNGHQKFKVAINILARNALNG